MPTVLLITEQQRVRWLFSHLEQERLFRLRFAPTLSQAEEEIATRLPEFVFVEDTISGLSGNDISGQLRRVLPGGAALVLMGKGSGEGVEIGGPSFLDLSGPDEALKLRVREIVGQEPPAEHLTRPAPPPVPAQTAREFLFGQETAGASGKNRSLLWAIPLVMALASLAVVALYPRPTSTPAASGTAARAAQPAGSLPSAATPAPAARQTAPDAAPAKPATNAGTPSTPATPAADARAQSTPAAGTEVPPSAAEKQPAPRQRPPAPSGSADNPPEKPAAAVRKATASRKKVGASGESVSYVVRPGDRLLRILMQDYGYSYDEALAILPEVRSINKQNDLDLLTPGQRLIIPARAGAGGGEQDETP